MFEVCVHDCSSFFFFDLVQSPCQDYFNSYEMGQLVVGEEPREKPPGTPTSRICLSHMCPVWGSNFEPISDIGEMIE